MAALPFAANIPPNIARQRRVWSTVGLWYEWGLALLVLAGIVWVWRYFSEFGYLPDPFFNDADATFTDWFDPAFWSHNPGTYDTFGSVYPPMSFVFLRILSLGSCYRAAARTEYSQARYCDPIGVPVLLTCVVLGLVLSFLAFRKANVRPALPRAIAVAVGCPMLWALERGNLIVPCYVFFVLAHGRLLRSGWLKSICAAVTFNFKPYLVISLVGRVLRRDWRWAEAVVIASALIWAASYAIIGAGTPGEIIRDIAGLNESVSRPSINSLHFTTSLYAVYAFVMANPVMNYVGSEPVDAVQLWVPIIRFAPGVLLAFFLLAAVVTPKAFPASRVPALIMSFYYVYGGPGGYAMPFLLFMLFVERWRGVNGVILLTAAYLWCVPWDWVLYHVYNQPQESFLSNTSIYRPINILLGDFARPALMLIIEFTLLFASGCDLVRALFVARWPARKAGLDETVAALS